MNPEAVPVGERTQLRRAEAVISAVTILTLGLGAPASVLAAPPNLWAAANAYRGATHCDAASPSCGFTAVDTDAQLASLASELTYPPGPGSVPMEEVALIVPEDVAASLGTITDAAHVQGVVVTSPAQGERITVFSTSANEDDDEDGDGVPTPPKFGFIALHGEAGDGVSLQRKVKHPSSVATIGKYALWAEGHKVCVVNTDHRYAHSHYLNVLHFDTIPCLEHVGFDGGYGGIAIVRLQGGKFLLALGDGPSKPPDSAWHWVHVEFYLLSGDLAEVGSLRVEEVGELNFTSDTPDGTGSVLDWYGILGPGKSPVDDNNLSLFADEDGRVFLYMPAMERDTAHAATGRRVYANFYEVLLSKVGGNWDLSASHARKFETASAHARKLCSDPLPETEISYLAGTSVVVDEDGKLRVYVLDDRHESQTVPEGLQVTVFVR